MPSPTDFEIEMLKIDFFTQEAFFRSGHYMTSVCENGLIRSIFEGVYAWNKTRECSSLHESILEITTCTLPHIQRIDAQTC